MGTAKRSLIGTSAAISAALVLAGAASAAPSGPGTAAQTVSALRANGFHVIVNKTGTAPLDSCVVTSLRHGQIFAREDSGAPGAGSSIVTTVTSKTVYVDVVC
ncbi:hypothetical protein [Mycolicibacterium sp. 120270]|uniref:hypothetical protein n=1 Tax=Mycolicibacterium sp. 120270 TaxID=3090600 RepID=UPI00299EB41B|nr:hypothetical protein [Mycolicibacterium sp. 120270]MDX1883202.1 hypothetical protein [Mycolicibacterium sp. 120270]